jgi:hypothetical protein
MEAIEAKEGECASCNCQLCDKVGELTKKDLGELDDDGNEICDYCYLMEFEEKRGLAAMSPEERRAELLKEKAELLKELAAAEHNKSCLEQKKVELEKFLADEEEADMEGDNSDAEDALEEAHQDYFIGTNATGSEDDAERGDLKLKVLEEYLQALTLLIAARKAAKRK